VIRDRLFEQGAQQNGIDRLQHDAAPAKGQPALQSSHMLPGNQKNIPTPRIKIRILGKLRFGMQIPYEKVSPTSLLVGRDHPKVPFPVTKSKQNLATEFTEELIARNQSNPHECLSSERTNSRS
jgi:hypothetical protein